MSKDSKVYLGKLFPGVYLTNQQARCINQLLFGKKSTEIAETLNITSRTVDFYLKLVKRKLNCMRRKNLISLIKRTEFLINFQEIYPEEAYTLKISSEALKMLMFVGNASPTQAQIQLVEDLLKSSSSSAKCLNEIDKDLLVPDHLKAKLLKISINHEELKKLMDAVCKLHGLVKFSKNFSKNKENQVHLKFKKDYFSSLLQHAKQVSLICKKMQIDVENRCLPNAAL